ncbi:MAG: BMP family ABC transporter substrate-binding protein [Ruminococcaceae bacterium]|nr:BMP family ABC transporter substrate-binding protein [Oscillospiraceae bacterium]
MKKIISLLLLAVMMLSCFVACGNEEEKNDVLTIGLICLHDENSTYDLNFINAMKDAQKALGLEDSQIIYKYNIPEGAECTDAATDLVENYGCDIIFANSFGHETFLMEAAKKYPDVQFCHATGTMAHTSTDIVKNFHNAFASIYEGRYLAGIAAGMKLNEMIESGEITAEQAKMGYVGAFAYAEVKSGYTSFYLGAKSVCPTVTMDVKFTDSWYDENKEKEAALALIENDCVLISQHADSMGAPNACEQAGVPNVSYNGSTVAACPNTFIVSSRIDWSPYYQYVYNCVKENKEIAVDWCGGISEGSVVLTDINDKAAAEGTKEAIDAAIAEFKAGTLHVFDTKNFTVAGETITSFKADVDTDANYEADTEVVEDGIFYESKYRSAPYFTLDIDGINIIG